MHITIDKELREGSYHLDFIVNKLNDAEKADFENQIKKFGKIYADFGGTFTEEVTKNVTDPITNDVTTVTETVTLFKFNENIREISDTLSYSRVFKVSQYGENAEKYATLYANEMDTRIKSVLDELKNKNDDFSTPDIEIHY